jgi:hypothetical protein
MHDDHDAEPPLQPDAEEDLRHIKSDETSGPALAAGLAGKAVLTALTSA